MLRTIGVLILLRCFDQVNSSLLEAGSLSHLEPVAELKEITSQGLKLDGEPPLLTPSQPGTVLKVESKPKPQDLAASCIKGTSSTFQDSQEGPSNPLMDVNSRSLEGRAIEQLGGFQLGTDVSRGFYKYKRLKAFEDIYTPPLSFVNGNAFISDDYETDIEKIDQFRRLCDFSNSLQTGQKDPKITCMKSYSGLDVFTPNDIARQSSTKNSNLLTLKTERANEDLKGGKSNTLQFKKKVLHDKLNINIGHEDTETQPPALKSVVGTKYNNDIKPALDPETSWQHAFLQKQALTENEINGSLDRNDIVKPQEKFLYKTQLTASNSNPVDRTVTSEEKSMERLKSQLTQTQPPRSKEKSVAMKQDSWIVVASGKNKKGSQSKPQPNNTQKHVQPGIDGLAIASQPELSELDKIEIRAQSQLRDEKSSSSEKPQYSFFKANTRVRVDKSPVSFHSKNLDKQRQEESSVVEITPNAQESSEMSSQEEKHTMNSDSIESLVRVKSGRSESNLPLEKTGPATSTEINQIPLKRDRKKRKSRRKKKVLEKNAELENDTDPSGDKTQPESKKHQLTPGLFKLQGRTSSGLSDFSLKANDKLPLNEHPKTYKPLPELQYTANCDTDNDADLWQSQLHMSPVNPNSLCPFLSEKATTVLQRKWNLWKGDVFPSAFSPWEQGREDGEIYLGFQKEYKTLKSETNELQETLQEHLQVSDKTQNLSLSDIEEEFFPRLQESWNLDKERFIAKLQAIQNDFGDINEFHRRLWTLSRQIFEHTIVQNWKSIKNHLIENQEFSKSDVEDIETTYQLSTRFHDPMKFLELSNRNLKVMNRSNETQNKIKVLLQKVLGNREAQIRIATAQYLIGSGNSPNWWAKTDYIQRIKGNGLSFWHVVAVGETLDFGKAEFAPIKDPKVRSKLLGLITSVFDRKELKVVPWYVSPERAFLNKVFPEFDHRMNVLLNEGRCLSVKNLYTITLVNKTNHHITRSVTHEWEDILHFRHKGIATQFMAEMLQYGLTPKPKNEQQWIELVDTFSDLFTEEQRDFVIKFFCSRRQRSQR
ncbi:hypothetical protein O181_029456 [Austropuccinia psidii MF-1]|uniref:Uncharacterized protein n=1 Tax=Austropuccinia psidii MF-1 TaxID=1389203 RepID=A0A9Q3CWH8_9BASI|nr:hypothetical protein [Austropuccinia psidii MF-1]